ncbi:D-alanyl-D-alanine carboxypeptidase [Azospirillum sp.]|uniref:D-alanyl-D-alanine carboxypeptidase n=1 Tax=Azospirillum sp. TaxID=34012 RepID=UPI002D61AB3B|nr:D-alanyl-D-alanine carboxypeptidase [Azospirillum sp.]HYD69352.1 D-alanyl-D-alanine carboxypeptidase [Azospirillum sp.]
MFVTQRAAHTGAAQFADRVQRPVGRGWLGAAAMLAALAMTWSAPALAVKYEAIVIDARTGQVLHEENADAITHPASLTKMMTLYLTFDALDAGKLSLDQALPVSEHAQAQSPTKLGLRAGSTIKVETAILGLVTKSANDASVVLAEAIGGSHSRFAEIMTRKARELGMKHTVFRNANGLPDDEQVTTARDFAMLSRALLTDHPKYYPYFSRRNFMYGGHSVHNHNRLMSRYDGMDGIKTGYIRASGFNLAASAVRDGRRLIAVVMGGKSAVSRDNRMAALLDEAFAKARRNGPKVDPKDQDAPVVAAADPEDDAKPAPATAQARPVPAAAAFPAKAKPGNAKLASPAKPQSIAQLAAAAAPEPPVRKGTWGVQVGAFNSRAAGQKALATATKQLPRAFADAKAGIVEVATKKGKVYRARLMGLDEKSARAACAELERSGHRCAAVGPGNGA